MMIAIIGGVIALVIVVLIIIRRIRKAAGLPVMFDGHVLAAIRAWWKARHDPKPVTPTKGGRL